MANYGQRLADASIGRRQGVDTAIIGDSTVQLLDPARLSRLTGRSVVSLAVTGSGPLEQLAIAEWFRRHHRGSAGLLLVIGINWSWCTTDDPITLQHPFPFWLYSDSQFDYAINLLNYKAFEAVFRRVKLLVGDQRMAPADGYHDYDTGNAWHFPKFQAATLEDTPAPSGPATEALTAAPLLRQFLARLDPATRVVLLIPPRHISALPRPGTWAGAALDDCKRNYRAIANSRAGTWLVDFLLDTPTVRRDENFRDAYHYRGPIARAMEDRLAELLKP